MDSRVKDKYQNNYLPQTDAGSAGKYIFIKTVADFKSAVSHAGRERALALDLEADSMFHFSEKVCLLQMATQHFVYVIDTLAINDMSALAKILADAHIQKILHGADYDIRCLRRDFNATVENLFDTELAARFLGYPETGLDAVLKINFDVALEKKYQKKDWSQRPLPEEMVDYAANDVRYLIALCKIQMQELKKTGRLEWVLEECAHLSKVRNQNNDGAPLFTRIKGAGRMDQRGLAVLESLLQYRLKAAKKKDRPPFKIIGNQALLKIALDKPTSLKQLKKAAVLSEKQIDIHGKALINITAAAMSVPKNQLPHYPRQLSRFPDAEMAQKIKKLKTWRQHKADVLKMDAGMLLNNSVLKIVVEKKPGSLDDLFAIPEMKNWQKEEFGKEIMDILTHR